MTHLSCTEGVRGLLLQKYQVRRESITFALCIQNDTRLLLIEDVFIRIHGRMGVEFVKPFRNEWGMQPATLHATFGRLNPPGHEQDD